MSMADVGARGKEAVVTFEGILTPRGRYNVELHLSFLRLQGQANDFKFQFSSIVRVFVLPKFKTDYVVESTLTINEDLFATKHKDKLEPSYKKPVKKETKKEPTPTTSKPSSSKRDPKPMKTMDQRRKKTQMPPKRAMMRRRNYMK